MNIKVLGVRIDEINLDKTLNFIKETITFNYQAQIATINPEFLVAAYYDQEFKSILNSCALNTCDGFGLMLIAKIFYRKKLPRTTGVEITEKLLQGTNKLFLLGSTSKVLEAIIKKFPQAPIVGIEAGGMMVFKNGNWQLENNELVLKKINNSGAEILLAAFEYGKQEKWLAQNLKKLPHIKIAIGVGGTFDYLSEKIKRAPAWMRKLGLEWLFRLIKQPQRWPRIIKATIIFPYLVIKEKIFQKYV